MSYRVLLWNDLPTQSGFGRIGLEVSKRLIARGHNLQAISLFYNGFPHGLPIHIWPLAGLPDIWAASSNIINGYQAQGGLDAVICLQDFPYSVSLFRDCRIDWGHTKRIIITPIDGEPVFWEWVEMAKFVDATMVISEFGVEALRKTGVRAYHCPPGVDANYFYPPTPEEKAYVRAKAGLPLDAFVIGMAAMNQGRKNIPGTIEAFKRFFVDKPKALLYLDMDVISGGGWDIEALRREMGIPDGKIFYRSPGLPQGNAAAHLCVGNRLPELRERFWLMDVHGVLAYREGFGLPLIEGMACRVPTFALDWCSGTEICSDGRGILVRRQPEMRYGTWGLAQDADPDVDDLVRQLNDLYYWPEKRAFMADKGRAWAVARTWDKTADAVEAVLRQLLEPQRTGQAELTAAQGRRD